MLRLNLSRVLLLLTVALPPAAFAAPPPSPAAPASPTLADHVKRGDAARRARRWADAADAYRAALEAAERERLPREASAPIAGELGLCELTLGRYRDAAEHLHRALEDPRAVTNEQLGRIRQGFVKAAEQVATIIAAINPSDGELMVDGKPVDRRAPTYVLFVEPGHHLLRARLEGYEDHETALDIPRGGSAGTGLKLRVALPRPAKPVTPIVLVGRGDALEGDAAEQDLDRSIGGVSLIPMISFGQAPSVSAGGVLDGRWRWPRLSIGADFRFMASETTDSVSAVRTAMGRTHVSVCGHRGFFSLCGVGGLGRLYAMKDPTIKVIETKEPWSGSIGIRPAAEWLVSEHLALRGFAEIHAIMGQATVWVDGSKLWAAPPVAAVVGVGMMVPFGRRGSDEKSTARMDAPRRY